ncbi:MAG TPA: hypothetical protein VGN57_04260 [Pirellulaceae bacterium]|jgi:beta-RFAP synthase|nr:hypothetical protein [Pirellulaceae bacterium]
MISPSEFRVVAPTRLHFGLLAIGEGAGASGGAGAMLSEPSLVLHVRPSDRFAALGLHADRIAAFAGRWAAGREEGLPSIEIRGESAPDQHVGLGLGTQLALATALALDQVTGREEADPQTLASLVGRGGRSGIGVRGFFLGGFLAEDEKRDGDSLAPLRRRLSFPERWRFVLVRQAGEAGAHGACEDRFFRALPPTPREVTDRMRRRLFDELVPAVEAGDFEAFAESAYQFGRASGELFRGAQAGTYASEFAERLVATLRTRGVRGIGQSSWGPTLWVAAPDPEAAESLAADLRSEQESANVDVTIGVPSSSGVRIDPTPDLPPLQDRPDEALSGMRESA